MRRTPKTGNFGIEIVGEGVGKKPHIGVAELHIGINISNFGFRIVISGTADESLVFVSGYPPGVVGSYRGKTVVREMVGFEDGFTVDETNSSFLSLDGVLFDKDMKTLLCCPSARQGDFIIPSSVCTIGEYGFYSCRYLKNVVLSPSLTNIQEGAFRLCTALRSVTLPSNVSSMGDNIFVACSALEKIVCYVPHPFDINASTFTSGNYNVPLYVLKRALDDYKNAPYWSQFATILPIDGTVVDGLLGDVNNDGYINMSDVTVIINYILGREVNDFRWQQADMNFDGFINMSDVTGVINFILGNTTEDTEE